MTSPTSNIEDLQDIVAKALEAKGVLSKLRVKSNSNDIPEEKNRVL